MELPKLLPSIYLKTGTDEPESGTPGPNNLPATSPFGSWKAGSYYSSPVVDISTSRDADGKIVVHTHDFGPECQRIADTFPAKDKDPQPSHIVDPP